VAELLETFLMYAPWRSRYRPNGHAHVHDNKERLNRMASRAAATHAKEAQRNCGTRRAACRSTSPYGENVCLLDRVSCDPYLSYKLYVRAMAYAVNASRHGECTAGLGWPPWSPHVHLERRINVTADLKLMNMGSV